MNTFFKVAGISCVLAGVAIMPASADGLYGSFKDEPIAAPCCASSWTGFYAGASVGYGQANSTVTNDISFGGVSTAQRDTISSDNATGTVSIGYDRAFGGGIVAGVFGDYTFGSLRGSGTLSGPGGYMQAYDIDYDSSWAAGGRIGLARSCCTLYYATGGYTQTDAELGQRFHKTLDGFFAGGGVEQMLHDGLSLKIEYRFSNYDTTNFINETSTVCGGVCSQRVASETEVHSIRVGLAYKLGMHEEYIAPLK